MFIPSSVLIEKDALEYPLGQQLYETFKEQSKVDVVLLKSNRVTGLPKERREKYEAGKKTIVIGVRKTMKFQSCKPSAHFQLPLVTGCIGQCEYCYLNTQFGDKPYTRVYVNVDDILGQAKKYIDEMKEITIFEGAATSDPLPMEDYTHSLAKTINFFGLQEKGRFRFVSKYNNVDSLLGLDHGNHTEIRFSINAEDIIKKFEHKTPSLSQRLLGTQIVIEAKYPSGFIIAPVFLEEGWQKQYGNLLDDIDRTFSNVMLDHPITFEIISHRFTARAKNIINEVFENSELPMDETERKFKYGQFGYGKYVYQKEQLEEMKMFFQQRIEKFSFPHKILYII
ncbi:spore photoproduct lyase [Vallitalea okinawensis]|uniref:spore photoproduct lyase n=1 Tax=Vallitalea okinawensis TaxID=2078660 RepID=UPI000CFCE31B|nr:spore photoproduct lyase [Vallitalea okinawensis]